jgi:hypothetical protein
MLCASQAAKLPVTTKPPSAEMSASLHGASFRPVSLRKHAHENGFSGVKAGAGRASLTMRIAAGDKSKKQACITQMAKKMGWAIGAVTRSDGEMVPDA